MQRFTALFFSLFLAIGISTAVFAAEKDATPAEAEAMVKKAIAYIKKVGPAKAFAEFTAKDPKFIDRDLYVVVYDFTGKCLAHGQNPKQVGKDLIAVKDPDGKEFVKERINIIKTKGKGWQEYKFSNPLSKMVEPKQMYIEKCEIENADPVIVGCGAYPDVKK